MKAFVTSTPEPQSIVRQSKDRAAISFVNIWMPLEERACVSVFIIKTDTHALSSSGIQIFTNEIAARSLLWRTILCGSGVEVTKAFMVLRGHDHVTHAGFPRKLGPIARRKRLRLELLGQGSVFRNRSRFLRAI